jgi:hypothetical protein
VNRYDQILQHVFLKRYQTGASEVRFSRQDLEDAPDELGIRPVKNLGDLVYSFRFRSSFPDAISSRVPPGREWIIRLDGASHYKFVAIVPIDLTPQTNLLQIKIPDATPGIVAKYALGDEQALLAKVRYNRLVDIFTGVACYSLQNHLRTTATHIGQVEIDELYVGVDRRGVQYVFPVQAKGGRDKLSIVQIEQDVAVCKEKYPDLICRPIAAQFISERLIALLEITANGLAIAEQRHYHLVAPEQVSSSDIMAYQALMRTND